MNKLLLALALSIPSLYGMDREALDEDIFEDTHKISNSNPNPDKDTIRKWELLMRWRVGYETFTITPEARESITRYAKTEDDDEPVGVVTAAIKDPNVFDACCFGDKRKAYIDVLAVAPSHRRTGIAQKLINTLLDDIQHDPHIEQVIGLVKRNNPAAAALFTKLGFAEQHNPHWAPRKFTYSFDRERKQK